MWLAWLGCFQHLHIGLPVNYYSDDIKDSCVEMGTDLTPSQSLSLTLAGSNLQALSHELHLPTPIPQEP